MATTEQRWVAGFDWDDQFICETVTVRITKKFFFLDTSSNNAKEFLGFGTRFRSGRKFHRTKDEAIAALIQTIEDSAAKVHEQYDSLMKQVNFLKGLSDGPTAT